MRTRALAFGAAAAVGILTVTGCATAPSRTAPARIPPLATGSGGGAAPAMFAMPGNVEYRFVGPLPALVSHALAYRVGATATPDRVAKLARGFGIEGSVLTDTGGWSATSSEHNVQVRRMSGLPFTVSTTGGSGSAIAGCAVAIPAYTSGSGPTQPGQTPPTPPSPGEPPPTCPPPTTVPGLPSSAEAQTVARAALAKAGFDLGATTVEVMPNPSQIEVSFHRSIGGVPMAGNPWTVAVGPRGAISFASGLLADPVVAGDYPLVGVSAGLDRLNQGSRWIVYGGPGPVPMMAAASGVNRAGPPVNQPAPPVNQPVPGVNQPAPPVNQPAPPVNQPTPPVNQPAPPVCSGGNCPVETVPPKVIVTVTGVHLGLAWAPLARTSMTEGWLVPVYVFELEHGGTVSVLALSDDVITPPGPEPVPPTLPGPKPSSPPSPSPVPAPPPPTGHRVVSLSDADNGRSVKVVNGDSIEVALHSTYWSLQPPSNTAVLQPQGSPAVSSQPQGCVPGQGCGSVVGHYLAASAGSSQLSAHRDSCGEAMRCTADQSSWQVTITVT